jgi:hypothetical protein
VINYYDMYGNPVSMERWSQLLVQPKHVAEDHLHIRGRRFHVSTVWLGLDHSFMGGPPMIFETMIFVDDGSFEDLYCARYSTREQALAGHRRAKRWLRRAPELHEARRPLIHKGGKPKVSCAVG